MPVKQKKSNNRTKTKPKRRAYSKLGLRIMDICPNGKNQRALAKWIRVSQQSVSRKLTGQAPFTVNELQIICEAEGIDIRALFTPQSVDKNLALAYFSSLDCNNPKISKLLELLSNLSDTQVDAIHRAAVAFVGPTECL